VSLVAVCEPSGNEAVASPGLFILCLLALACEERPCSKLPFSFQ
jgi:hypothetical protein